MANPEPYRNEFGEIVGVPLIGQTTYRLPNGNILLVLEIARTPQQMASNKGEILQLFVHEVEAMELARMLTNAAEAPYLEND